MYISSLVVSTLVATAVDASLTSRTNKPQSRYKCQPFNVTVPVVNATVLVPGFPEFQNSYQATYFANLAIQRDAPTPELNFSTLTKNFSIVGSVCSPVRPNANTSVLHIATHGLGFNRSYWDFYLPSAPHDNQYSYVSAATDAGYTVLTYDRLGIGQSSHANPYTEIQGAPQLAILIGLTTLARTGHTYPLLPQRSSTSAIATVANCPWRWRPQLPHFPTVLF
jgi:hypothetical protein